MKLSDSSVVRLRRYQRTQFVALALAVAALWGMR